ncbi:MAG: heparan-alpha-glucosaminide N-acetyltransferase [Sulfurimonas sp.]|nr:heparan-alpha-glucosaminide N-acetyltransferase [Sulfurimonas sp.]
MRLQGLDIFRGVAIVLMVIFHFCFDLKNFGYVDFDLRHGEGWKYFRYTIVTMFILSAGISAQLTHAKGIDIKKLRKRVLLLTLASLVVSIGSYTQFPNSWIYFGILHFFLAITILGLPFLNFPKLSLLTGAFIILGYNMSWINMHWLYTLLQKPLHLPIAYTQDLVSLVPWFGVYLLGLAAGYYKLQEIFLNLEILNRKNLINSSLALLGRHSFIIYLSHQIVLFVIFYLIVLF